MVTVDEAGRSVYHSTGIIHEILIEIWNPTNIGVKICASVKKTNDRKISSGTIMPAQEVPFQVEGTFMLGPNEKNVFKVFFKSIIPGDFTADLVLEASPVQNLTDMNGTVFQKTIKLKANADEPVIARDLKHPESAEYLQKFV